MGPQELSETRVSPQEAWGAGRGCGGGALLVAFHNVVGGDISILGLPDTPG